MKVKHLFISILFGALFIGAPFAHAQQPLPLLPTGEINYIECGHCTLDGEDPGIGDCVPGGACDIDIRSQLKYLPYKGIPEVASTTPLKNWIALGFIVVLGLIIILI